MLKHLDDLCGVEPCHLAVQSLELFQNIQQLSKLQEVFKHVEVPRVLIETVQVADEGMVHLCHVLDLVVDVLLLARLKNL